MKKPRVLFICAHNSARSQIAAALLNHICGDVFEAESAGLEPGTLNPLAAQAMQEIGIDIFSNPTRGVFDVWKSGRAFAYVITVCTVAETEARKCPVFPGAGIRFRWPFDDPSDFAGTDAAKLEKMRCVRDAIKVKIEEWCEETCPVASTSLK